MATFRWCAATALLALLGPACAAAGGRGPLSAVTPAVAGLTDLAGAPVDLATTVADHDATLLVWWSTRCPCVKRYHDRIEALRAAYPAERVAMVAIASNADDDPERLRRVAAERGLTLPVMLDPGAALADHLDVRSTPTIVVLDHRAAVRFLGWIDNERAPGTDGRVAYAREALDAVLAAEPPPRSRSPFYGCTITRSLGSPAHCKRPPNAE